MTANTRDKIVTIYASEAERERMRRAAAEEGKSLSKLLLRLGLEYAADRERCGALSASESEERLRDALERLEMALDDWRSFGPPLV